MRIDVQLDHGRLDAELASLLARVRSKDTPIHDLPAATSVAPGLALSYREVDGEFYVYAEDRPRDAVAGCTVFNRVFELDRNMGRYVRSPHSRYAAAYRQRGLASTVYRWALNAGLCLISGPRQSVGAHRLWMALARSYEMTFVRTQDRRLQVIGPQVDARVFESYDTRMLLLGSGWTLPRFVSATQCEMASATTLHMQPS